VTLSEVRLKGRTSKRFGDVKMRKMQRLVLLNICINLVLILLVRGWGTSHSRTDLKSLMLLDCKLPCWIGIYPGVTTPVDAEVRVSEVYTKNSNYVVSKDKTGISGFQIFDKANNTSFQVEFAYWRGQEPEQRRFHEIIVRPCGNCMQLGDAFNLLGRPSRVFPESIKSLDGQVIADKSTLLIYDDLHLIIATDNPDGCHKLRMSQFVISISIYSEIPNDYADSKAWQGFNTCYVSP